MSLLKHNWYFCKDTESNNLHNGVHNENSLFVQIYDLERWVKTLFASKFEIRNTFYDL